MSIEHKIVIFAIISALVGILSIVAYNTYDSTLRTQAYRDCVATNKIMAEMITSKDSNSLRISSIPTCYMR